MPSPQASRSRRVAQCCYSENGRRCRRSATGNPPLCNPHTIAAAEQLRERARRGAPDQPLGEGIYNLADRLLNRRKVSRKVLEEAAVDVMGWWDRIQTPVTPPPGQGASPGEPPRRPTWEEVAARAKRVAEEAARRAEQARQRRAPPVDPREHEERVARARARHTLGFTLEEEITADKLKQRQRELAKRHHPDRGGSVAKMQEINAAVDALAKSLVP